MYEILSPITKNSNVQLECELETQTIIQKYNDEYNLDVSSYFQGLKNIQIYKCNETGYRFYYPLSLAGDEKFYEDLQEKMTYFSYYPEWKWENEIALKYINKNDNVLEVGCGSGMFLTKLKAEGISGTGLEFNDKAVLSCKQKDLNVFKIDINDHANNFPEKYDVVCHFQVFEHIEDPQNFIDACLKALKPNGRLIIGVPNSNPYLYKTDVYHTLNTPPHHLGLWNKNSLRRFAEYLKLDIEMIKVEPLIDLNYYFAINYPFLRLHNRFIHRLNFLKYFFEGRNVIAILKKR